MGLSSQKARRGGLLAVAAILLLVNDAMTVAHVFVPASARAGAYPKSEGLGWIGEVYLGLPDAAAIHLLAAEAYIDGPPAREPDFTFRTDWIDFPAGPVSFTYDSDAATIGDFFGDAVYDVSDPSKLAAPMSHFLLRFTGYLKVTLEDESRIRSYLGLPVWVDFGTMGYDGYRTEIGGQTAYRTPNANSAGPWYNFGPSCEVLGLFPIVITYFNNYDPFGERGAPYSGIELYSWHGDGLAWPAGEQMTHAVRGPGTLVPPRVIYQIDDPEPIAKGDFDADGDVDLRDFQWFQVCFGGSIVLAAGCDWLDFDEDVDVDADDFAAMRAAIGGP
jgi:hypothetical protein